MPKTDIEIKRFMSKKKFLLAVSDLFQLSKTQISEEANPAELTTEDYTDFVEKSEQKEWNFNFKDYMKNPLGEKLLQEIQ